MRTSSPVSGARVNVLKSVLQRVFDNNSDRTALSGPALSRPALSRSFTCTLMLLVSALGLSQGAIAADQIYKTVDAQGNVTFTDIAPKNAGDAQVQQVQVAPANSYETSAADRADPTAWIVEDPTADADEDVAEFYRSARITSPTDDAGIRENAGNVTITAEVLPRLRPGHQLRLLIDGTVEQVTRATSFQLTSMDRGTHVAQVDVVNADGRVLFSGQPSSFHLQRHSVLHGAAGP